MRLRRALGAAVASLLVPLAPLAAPSPAAAASGPRSSGRPGTTGVLPAAGKIVTPRAASSSSSTRSSLRFEHPTRDPGRLTKTKEQPAPPSTTATGLGSAAPQVATSSNLSVVTTIDGTRQSSQSTPIEPPDGAVAAGATQVVEMVNAQGRVVNKSTGQLQSVFDLDHFFSPGDPTPPETSDPRVQWDPVSSRFWASVVVLDFLPNGDVAGELRVGYSSSSDPTSQWVVTTVLPLDTNRLPDQPRLAVTQDKVVISWDEFQANGAPVGGRFRVVDKADLLNNVTAHFFDPTPDPAWWGIVPAVPTSTSTTAWAGYNGTCTSYNPNPTASAPECPVANYVGVLRITGTPAAGTTAAVETHVPFSGTWIPPNAPQGSSSAPLLDTGDDRFNTASVQGSHLWISGNDCSSTPQLINFFHVCPTGARSALRLVGIDVSSTPALFSADPERVADASSAVYYGGVAQDSAGNVFSGFTVSSSTMFPSLGVAARLTNGTITGIQIVRAGGGVYSPSEPQGQAPRWGDYAGAAQDPSTPSDVWVEGEWKAANSNTPTDWSTSFSRLRALPVVSSVTPSSGPTAGGQTVTIAGSGFTASTQVFFGTAQGTNVQIQSPNLLTVTTPAHAAGAVPVTVTTDSGTSTDNVTYTYGDADLVASLTHAPEPAPAGGTTTYTLTAHNNGPDAAVSATATATVPASGATITAVTPSAGSCSGTTSPVTCDLGAVASGSSATVTIQVRRCTTGSFNADASVSSNQDPDTSNNTATDPTSFGSGTVPCPPSNVTAVGGVRSAAVSWSAPPANGGPTISQYTVRAYVGATVVATKQVTGSPPPTSATVSQLTPGTYTFTVDATNSAGTTAQSAASAPTTVYPQLAVSGVSPNSARTSSGQASVHVFGNGFSPSSTVSFGGQPSGQPGITVAGVTFVSSGELVADARFSNGSARMAYDVTVSDPNDGAATLPSSFTLVRSGYWMVGADGAVYAFGDAPWLGGANQWIGPRMGAGVRAVALVVTANGDGYCVVDNLGESYCFNAGYPNVPPGSLQPGEQVTSASLQPHGSGIWYFTNKGRAFAMNGAPFFGDMSGTVLNGPVLGSVATPTGQGYYMVASDGGVFSFGDARFHGSMGGRPLNGPVQGLAPTPDNAGYWLVASDGGIFAFDAPFRGSMGGRPLNKPVIGMVPFGDGYLMVASDGGIFDFSDRPFDGSLGSNPPAVPVANVAPMPA